jgi:NAD(P)-dependent dehydrogenase (short-subunit alcohol dehydrogenase family)
VKAFSGMQGQTEEEGWEWFRGRIPLGRFQTPTDIGEMVAFLASDRAHNITGAAFNVDGGWEMH